MDGLVRADNATWTFLLSRSPQRTRFLDPDFLSLFDCPVRLYVWERKGVPAIGLPIIDASEWNDRALPMCYYQGLIYNNELLRGQASKSTQNQVELAEMAITALCEVEPNFAMSLHPSLTDMRGLDWVHYHDQRKARLSINPRYTAIFDLEGHTTESIRSVGRSSRRQEENYAKSRENLRARTDGCLQSLMRLYQQTFAKQGRAVDDKEVEILVKYVSYFLDADLGHIVEVIDASDNAVAAGFVFEDYDNLWHVPLIGVGDTRYGGTLLYYAMLDFVHARGARSIDFNGANSPRRSYFKHSMGAEAKLYFDVDYLASEA